MRERDSDYLLSDQYRTASNLQARIDLHERYSTNPVDLQRWIFDQLKLPLDARILELGCGNGNFWIKNRARVPNGWRVTLTDFSQGMIRETEKNLTESHLALEYRVADAQSLPFLDGTFDCVLANYMLYHIPDLDGAIREVARVLVPSGRLYAATNGKGHMEELRQLSWLFDADKEAVEPSFSLENGEAILRQHFGEVVLKRFQDSLNVTAPAAIVDYVLSSVPKERLTHDAVQALHREVQRRLTLGKGVVRVTENTGLFEARGPRPRPRRSRS
jgi:SAM-dependent methyltransferase